MRWARFERAGVPSYGIIEEDIVEAVDGTPFGEYRRTGDRHRLDRISWLPPVIPPTFYCVGLNYAEHIAMEAKLRGVEPVLPAKPDVGYRARSALVGHLAPIVLPPGRNGPGGVRRRARVHRRPDREAPDSKRRARLPARIHHRKRRERTLVAGRGPDAVACEEHRHLQADGAVDRDRLRPRRGIDPGAGQRPGSHRVPHRSHDLRRGRTISSRSPGTSRCTPATCYGWAPRGTPIRSRPGTPWTSRSPGSER